MLHIFSPIVFPNDLECILAVNGSDFWESWTLGKLPTRSGECPTPWFWGAAGFWGNTWWRRALSPPSAKPGFILKTRLAGVSVFPSQACVRSLTLRMFSQQGLTCDWLKYLLWAPPPLSEHCRGVWVSQQSDWLADWGVWGQVCLRTCITQPPPSVFLLYYKVWLTLHI